MALNKGQDRPDLRIAQHVLEALHGTLIAWGREALPAVFGGLEQVLVGMVPGMAGFVEGWRRRVPRRQTLLPVGLAFKIGPVTGRTVLGIHGLTYRDLRGVAWIGP